LTLVLAKETKLAIVCVFACVQIHRSCEQWVSCWQRHQQHRQTCSVWLWGRTGLRLAPRRRTLLTYLSTFAYLLTLVVVEITSASSYWHIALQGAAKIPGFVHYESRKVQSCL